MKTKFLLNKKNYRFIIIALAMLLSCFSCTKEERKEAVSSEIFQTTESIVEPEKYRYIINIGEKSGKVHTYHHGTEIIENPNHIFKTNESLEEILNNVVSDKRTAYDIDLWGTGSELFSYKRSKIINKLVMDSKKFKFIDLTSMDNYNNILAANKNVNNIDLRPGDMIYRKINYKDGIDGHVEFYIGNNRVMSWGRVHKSYYLNKIFKKQGRFFYSNDVNDKEQPYVAIIRFKGDKYEQKN